MVGDWWASEDKIVDDRVGGSRPPDCDNMALNHGPTRARARGKRQRRCSVLRDAFSDRLILKDCGSRVVVVLGLAFCGGCPPVLACLSWRLQHAPDPRKQTDWASGHVDATEMQA